MRTSRTTTLPSAEPEYRMDNERIMRRTAEQAFDDLRSDMVEVRDKTDKPASLAMRRHQFLLMGAS